MERVRKETEQPVTAAPRRFATIEVAPEMDVRSASVGHTTGLERFSPEPNPPLVLEPDDTEQPFVRCHLCGADSSRHATACLHCEARLDTPENRDFNTRLWTETKAARELEDEEARLRHSGKFVDSAPPSVHSSQAEDELASQMRAQLALGELERGGTPSWLGTSRGSTLRAPLVVGLLALGLPALLLAAFHRSPIGGAVLFAVLATVLLVVARRAP